MNLVAVKSVLFFDMEVIISTWVYRCFSLVARAATLGNSCNLYKSKMAAMDSRFASGRDIIQLSYLKSCVTPLCQIIFLLGIVFFGVNFVIRCQSFRQNNVKFKVIFGQGM